MSNNFTHIVNGSNAADALANAGVKRSFLPWDDVLHEGPRPQGLGLDDFSEVRAGFIASSGWAKLEDVQNKFRKRNEKFVNGAKSGNLLIWNSFELYDQLHLLEILNWFHGEGQGCPPASIVFVEDYLGHLIGGSEVQKILRGVTPVTNEMLSLGKKGWEAFTSDTSEKLSEYIKEDLSSLPFMKKAMGRWSLELPDKEGLNQTARMVLESLEEGAKTPIELFRDVQSREEIRFMGDLSFWNILNSLAETPHNKIAGETGPYISADGADVGNEFLSQKIILL